MHSPAHSSIRPAIASWWSDPLLIGGLSLLVMIPLFFVDDDVAAVVGGELLVVNLFINWPHFMASYRLLFGSPEMVRAHPAAAISVPLARVEANRAKTRPLARLAVWALVLVVAGHVVFRMLAGALQDVALAVSSPKSLVVAIPLAVTVFVNVHHDFTDGVLWKLRNPEVRRDLFKHLERA